MLFLAGLVAEELFSRAFGLVLDLLAGRLPRVDWSTFPYSSLGWGLFVGLVTYAVWFRLLFPDPSREERRRMLAMELAARAEQLIDRIEPHRHPAQWTAESDPLDYVVADGMSLLISFGKAGLMVPALGMAAWDTRSVALGMLEYFRRMVPLLRDGHLGEARALAPKVSEAVGARKTPPVPES